MLGRHLVDVEESSEKFGGRWTGRGDGGEQFSLNGKYFSTSLFLGDLVFLVGILLGISLGILLARYRVYVKEEVVVVPVWLVFLVLLQWTQ